MYKDTNLIIFNIPTPSTQPYEFEPIWIPGTVYGFALQWQDEIVLRNGSTVPPNYMVTIKRIRRLKRADSPLEFVPSYAHGRATGSGLHLSIMTYAKLYQSLFTLPSPGRSRKTSCSIMQHHATSCNITHSKHYPSSTLSNLILGFDVSDCTQLREKQNDDDDDDEDKEDIEEDEGNPWKSWKDSVMLYDQIFPEAATTGTNKSEKNKVYSPTNCMSLTTRQSS